MHFLLFAEKTAESPTSPIFYRGNPSTHVFIICPLKKGTPFCFVLPVQAARGGWGTLPWHVLVSPASKRESSSHQNHCSPRWSLHGHSVPLLAATFSRKHFPKLQRSQTGSTAGPVLPAFTRAKHFCIVLEKKDQQPVLSNISTGKDSLLITAHTTCYIQICASSAETSTTFTHLFIKLVPPKPDSACHCPMLPLC